MSARSTIRNVDMLNTTRTSKAGSNTARQKMVSIIDSHTGFETGRTAADSAGMKNIDLSELNNKTIASPEMNTGRNFSVGLDTGISTARSAMHQTGPNAFKAVH